MAAFSVDYTEVTTLVSCHHAHTSEQDECDGEHCRHNNRGECRQPVAMVRTEAAQEERVRHDGDGAECHCKASKFWTEHNAKANKDTGGNGDANDVVEE